MKKNIHPPRGKQSAPPSHFPYELSISMIVKNDVTFLKKCLDSLKPLRDALNCQMIITDTGSTDGTKELAQEQADLFLEFPWCDDFAKARNVGLEKAQGRWLFYLDADNELDDSYQAIVDFIRSPAAQGDKHPYATMMMRNYYGSTSDNHLRYDDMIYCLLVNFTQKKRYFVGRIHESIPLPAVEVPHLTSLVHHWGYADEKPKEKKDRNINILREVLAQHPNDLKQHLQYLRENLSPEETREHISKVLSVIQNPKNKSLPDFSLWSMLCLIYMADFYLKQEDYKEADATVQLLHLRLSQDTSFKNTIVALEIYGLAYALSLGKQAPLLDTLQSFQEYQQLFYKLKQSPNKTHVIFYDYPHTTEGLFYTLELALVKELTKDGQKAEALSLLETSTAYEIKNPKGQYLLVKEVLTLALQLEALPLVGRIHDYLQGNPTGEYLFQYAVEEQRSSLSPDLQQNLFALVGKSPTDAYTALCYFRSQNHQLSLCPPQVKTLLQESTMRGEEPFLSSLVYGYMKHQESLCLPSIPRKAYPKLVESLGNTHGDFFSLVLASLQSDTFAIHSLQEEQFWVQLGYEVLVHLTNRLDTEKGEEVAKAYGKDIIPCFKAVTELTKHYIDTVYNPNILSYEGISVLSTEEHFGFYCAIALESETSDSLQYIRTLKEAIKIAPKYQSLVYFLIAQQSQGNQENQNESPVPHTPHNGEFSALAVEVKKNILLYLTNGQIDTAKLLLDKYRTIQPNDPDLSTLLARCGM